MSDEEGTAEEAILWFREFSSSSRSKTFVVIPKQQNNPFFDDSKKDQAAVLTKELGENIECYYVGPVNAVPEDQIAIVREVMEQRPRVDGIAI
jgi:ABC-type sugar transport system substrate-binding protein